MDETMKMKIVQTCLQNGDLPDAGGKVWLTFDSRTGILQISKRQDGEPKPAPDAVPYRWGKSQSLDRLMWYARRAYRKAHPLSQVAAGNLTLQEDVGLSVPSNTQVHTVSPPSIMSGDLGEVGPGTSSTQVGGNLTTPPTLSGGVNQGTMTRRPSAAKWRPRKTSGQQVRIDPRGAKTPSSGIDFISVEEVLLESAYQHGADVWTLAQRTQYTGELCLPSESGWITYRLENGEIVDAKLDGVEEVG